MTDSPVPTCAQVILALVILAIGIPLTIVSIARDIANVLHP